MTGAVLCATDTCGALATHAALHRTLDGATTSVLCQWCAGNHQYRHHPSVTVTALAAYAPALAAAAPDGQLYRITAGILGDPRPIGICNSAEARLRLGQAQRDGWAVQIFPGGGWRAASVGTGRAGQLTTAITLTPHPVPPAE